MQPDNSCTPTGGPGATRHALNTDIGHVADVPTALEVLSMLVPLLEGALDGLGDRQVRLAEAPGKWSILQVVQHLTDTELVYGHRVRLALTEDTPALPRFDQNRWAERLHYDEARLPEVLGQLRALRARNLRLFRALGEAELARVAVHDSRGPETVGAMIVHMARHDAKHRAQIARIRRALGHPPAGEALEAARAE